MSIKKIFSIFTFLIFTCSYANAQIKIEKKYKMWESQFIVEGKSKVCFAVSMPTRMSPKSLNRAEARIFVTFRPSEGVSNEISITNGYPFSKKSNANVNVGNAQFKFETKGKFAWMAGLDDELKMIRAMKKANKAHVIGKSSRGNKTKDTYSLMGFTDAYNSAKKNCKK